MTTQYKKPVPRPLNPEHTKPFWDAAKRHELVLPRCTKCSRYHFYPREECPYCMTPTLEWVKVSGKGRLYTYNVVYQPQNRAFVSEVPYVYAVIQLEEGVKMVSNIVGRPKEELKVDMPVEAVFEDVTPEWTLVKFKPV
ncbi:MAG: Zn-ribbon domain-containing OB-fold protein [Chloroflexi bacterium]|nr:Zn-ribbon domain-containing OB-fold protein [Chloroflexota bacterium]